MSDPTAGNGGALPVASASSDSNRTLAIIVYALYLGALVNGLTAIIGVIVAYAKRDDARGTIYESHFANAIEVFWVSLVLCLAGIATVWFGIGVLIFIGAFVWFVYRTVKGLLRAVDSKPYV